MSTSVSAPNPASRRNSGKPSALRAWVIGIGAVLLTLLLFLLVRVQGYVRGSEFAPTHFQQRDFSFYEIPLLRIQITPIRRTGTTPSTARFLRQKALVKPHTGAPQTWHLVSISRGLAGSTPADAELLISQLGIRQGSDPYWKTWSNDHPAHAKLLWPVVQKLAERELYVLLPELFEVAQLEQTPQQLQQRIDGMLRVAYVGLIQDMRAANRFDLADQLLDEALADYPADPNLQELRESLPASPDDDRSNS